MIGYMDVTWCGLSLKGECDGSCGREFTAEDRRKAIKWFGSEDFPLILCDTLHEEVRK
jgi:hypothetical protein